MKALIKGGIGIGWFDYNLYGTKKNPRNKDLIEILDGDGRLGDRISKQGHWKENEYHIVLGFKGKPPRQVIRNALKDFKKNFMAGFSQDEYHFDAIAHYDTDDTHIHIRIPKMNLLTGTQLQLYWHKKDVARVNLIRDQINFDYDLDVTVDEKPLIDESKDMERIQKWRAERGQEPFVFDTKKNKTIAKQMIAESIRAEHEDENLDSLGDLRLFFVERYPQYAIVNEGYDIPKDFHYFTIQNKEGKKLRLDGEFCSEDFWTKTRELRLDQFENNKAEQKHVEVKRDISDELAKATAKRIEEVEQKYRKARARANQERGREEARAKKYQLKKEENELSVREDQAIRSGVSTERPDNRRTADSVQVRATELVSNSFIIHSGTSEDSDRRASAEIHRERAVSHIAEIKELDEELTEAIAIEADTERFGIEFEEHVKGGIREFKAGLNKWARSYIEENGRKIRERIERFKEGAERLEERLGQVGKLVEEWLDNAPVRKAHKFIKEEKERNAIKKGSTGGKPRLTNKSD